MSEKLSLQEKRDVVVESGITAIPYVGGSLSALYFGVKREKRFKRLEKFYVELNDKISSIESLEFIDCEAVDKKLVHVIEEINESIESDYANERISYLKNCFINSIRSDIVHDFDKERYFISLLSKLTNFDIEVINILYNAEENHGLSHQDENTDGGIELNVSLDKLKALGLFNSRLNGKFKMGVNWGKISLYTISDFGREFVNYCLSEIEL